MRKGIRESSGISSGEKIFFLSSLALLAVAFVLGRLKPRYGRSGKLWSLDSATAG